MIKLSTFLLIILLLLISCSSRLDKSLNDLDSKELNLKISTLESLRDEDTLKYKRVFLKAFNDDNSDVVWRAIDISSDNADKELIEKFVDFLDSDDLLISYTAKDSLIKAGPDSEEILLKHFENFKDKTKILILKCLGKIGSDKTLNFNFPPQSDNVQRYLRRTLAEIELRQIKRNLKLFISELLKIKSKQINSFKEQ